LALSYVISLLVFLMLWLTGCGIQVPSLSTPIQSPTKIKTQTPEIVPSTLTPNIVYKSEPTEEIPLITFSPAEEISTEVKPWLCSPLAEHEINQISNIVSSPYDPPPLGKDERHQGVDFAYYNQGSRKSIDGEGVRAIMSGWVVIVVLDRLPYGNMVILETPGEKIPDILAKKLNVSPGESIYHLYAHFIEPPLWNPQEWVECGNLLGAVGKSGYNIPVAHLHLEARIGPAGAKFDGMVYYDSQASERERENYELWRMSGKYRHIDPMILLLGSYMETMGRE
jgi:murein DD-endopeptidase MepM/ murein hydrolase activator NlpD